MSNDVKVTARIPKAKGMKFIRFERIPLNKLSKRPGKNTSREAGFDQKNVDDFVTIMRDEKYEPEYHIPPVVTIGPKGVYYIESGEHRYQAHLLMADDGYSPFKTFYAAVVEFQDEGGLSAEYWNEVWVTKENTQAAEFVRKSASKDDVANAVANLVKSKIINKDDNSIDLAIKNMGVSPNAGMFQTIKSKVWAKLGNGAKVVQGIHGKAAQAFVEKYAEQESLKNVPIPQTFKELDDTDYDWRLLKRLIKLYVKSPKAFKDLLVVAHTNGADPNKVRLIRNRKADLLERFEREMREFINKIDTSGVPFKTNIVWQPQLDGEIDDENPYKVMGWKKQVGK